ncbi:MAG: hypothetical protein RSA29_14425 [Clostridium sp.]|uniref:hypothetical protein n=1 Tax=Clostridium sp. TaxID=1506 RepID=UPI003218022A
MRKKTISLSILVAICLMVGLYSTNKVLQSENKFISNNSIRLLSMGSDLESFRDIIDPGITNPK